MTRYKCAHCHQVFDNPDKKVKCPTCQHKVIYKLRPKTMRTVKAR